MIITVCAIASLKLLDRLDVFQHLDSAREVFKVHRISLLLRSPGVSPHLFYSRPSLLDKRNNLVKQGARHKQSLPDWSTRVYSEIVLLMFHHHGGLIVHYGKA